MDILIQSSGWYLEIWTSRYSETPPFL